MESVAQSQGRPNRAIRECRTARSAVNEKSGAQSQLVSRSQSYSPHLTEAQGNGHRGSIHSFTPTFRCTFNAALRWHRCLPPQAGIISASVMLVTLMWLTKLFFFVPKPEGLRGAPFVASACFYGVCESAPSDDDSACQPFRKVQTSKTPQGFKWRQSALRARGAFSQRFVLACIVVNSVVPLINLSEARLGLQDLQGCPSTSGRPNSRARGESTAHPPGRTFPPALQRLLNCGSPCLKRLPAQPTRCRVAFPPC